MSISYTGYIKSILPGLTGTIICSGDMYVPCDLSNADYQAFLAWVAEGNTAPEGWTGPTNPTISPPPEGTA